jgi:hypothetical protein
LAAGAAELPAAEEPGAALPFVSAGCEQPAKPAIKLSARTRRMSLSSPDGTYPDFRRTLCLIAIGFFNAPP